MAHTLINVLMLRKHFGVQDRSVAETVLMCGSIKESSALKCFLLNARSPGCFDSEPNETGGAYKTSKMSSNVSA